MNYQEWIEQFGNLTPWDAWRTGVYSAAQVVEEYLKAYPTDIFIPPPVGQHGKTVDACSAAALRAILPNIERDIKALAEGSSMNSRRSNNGLHATADHASASDSDKDNQAT